MLSELPHILREGLEKVSLAIEARFRLSILERTIGKIDKTDYVDNRASKLLMQDPTVLRVDEQIESSEGTDEEQNRILRSLMSRLSPAQQRALIMIQIERIQEAMARMGL